MFITVDIKDSRGQHHPLSMCILHNKGTESIPDLSVERQVNGTCQHNGTKNIYFTAEKVPYGNYVIEIKVVDDDRCETDTIWTVSGHCYWLENATGIESDDVSVVSVKYGATMWITVIVVVIVFHAVICIWVLIRRQRQPPTQVESEYITLRPRNNSVNLLLLYPRDCFDFMKTMSSFRRLMERFDNIEVHDCHTAKGELHDPLDWLRKVLHYPKLFIIVVSSHCAYVQQEAILSGEIENTYDIYRNPTFTDCVFPYGLKQIMNDFTPNVYQKIHIIGFKGFTQDEERLELPSSLRRYFIPEHLEKLLSELQLDCIQGERLNETAEYLSLLHNVKTLRNFKIKNPDYLSWMLNFY